jgi:hypothetical protein
VSLTLSKMPERSSQRNQNGTYSVSVGFPPPSKATINLDRKLPIRVFIAYFLSKELY